MPADVRSVVRHDGTVGILFRVMNPTGSSFERPETLVLRSKRDGVTLHNLPGSMHGPGACRGTRLFRGRFSLTAQLRRNRAMRRGPFCDTEWFGCPGVGGTSAPCLSTSTEQESPASCLCTVLPPMVGISSRSWPRKSLRVSLVLLRHGCAFETRCHLMGSSLH